MSTAPEFVYLRQIGYTGSLADMRNAYYNDLINGKITPYGGDTAPSVGEFVPDIEQWTQNAGAAAPATGVLALSYFTAKKTETINNISVVVGTTAAAATPTLIRWGIWDVNATDDSLVSLLASTPNDTTLLAAPNTQYTKALSAPWNKIAGKRYVFGQLVVSAFTMPIMCGFNITSTNAVQSFAALVPRRFARVNAQSDLPFSVAAGSLANASFRIGVYFS